MGYYNSKYEKYYNSLINDRRKGKNISGYKIRNGNSNFFTKRIIKDLVGVFFLLTFIIFCKGVKTQNTLSIYKYSKTIVQKNYDYKDALIRTKNFMLYGNIQDKVVDFIDEIKVKVIGGETIKEIIKDKFSLPAKGELLEDDKNGVFIKMEGNKQVYAAFHGRVKELGEDEKGYKFIIIDHGKGIESKYWNLDKVAVEKGSTVNKGDSIGESEEEGKIGQIGFKIMFMGQNKNLEKLLCEKIKNEKE